MILRRAKAIRNVLEKITLFIEEGQLLAGNHAASLRAASIFPEYTIDWINDEIDQFDKRPGDRFYVTEEGRSELLDSGGTARPFTIAVSAHSHRM